MGALNTFRMRQSLSILTSFLSLICLSSASPTYQQQVTGSISSALFQSLEEASRIVDIAYCVGSLTGISPPFNCLSRCNDFPTFTLVQEWNTGPLLSDSCGYIAVDHDPRNRRILVAFRGTYSLANTIADLSTMPQRYTPYLPPDNQTSIFSQSVMKTPQQCDNCTVHAGFLSSWQNTRTAMLPGLEKARADFPGHKFHLVGHSLGGAIALLSALELQARGWEPLVTTFGEPRVGNDAFVQHVDAQFPADVYRRVTHVDDPVPLLPPSHLGYKSHANEIYIGKDALPPGIEDVKGCTGDEDPSCAAAGSGSRLWQLFFAHRDYFWRLGLCIKGGDPWDWKGEYDYDEL